MSKGRWENGVNWRHPQRMQFKQAGSHGNTSRGGNSMGQPQFLFDFRIRRKFETVFLTWFVFWLVVYLSIVLGVRQRAAYIQFRTSYFLSANRNFIERNHKCRGKDKTPSTYEQSQMKISKLNIQSLNWSRLTRFITRSVGGVEEGSRLFYRPSIFPEISQSTHSATNFRNHTLF